MKYLRTARFRDRRFLGVLLRLRFKAGPLYGYTSTIIELTNVRTDIATMKLDEKSEQPRGAHRLMLSGTEPSRASNGTLVRSNQRHAARVLVGLTNTPIKPARYSAGSSNAGTPADSQTPEEQASMACAPWTIFNSPHGIARETPKIVV